MSEVNSNSRVLTSTSHDPRWPAVKAKLRRSSGDQPGLEPFAPAVSVVRRAFMPGPVVASAALSCRVFRLGPHSDSIHPRGKQPAGQTVPSATSPYKPPPFMIRTDRPTGSRGVARRQPADDSVGRMEFLLSLRRRGISNAAVLKAMDEVPREQFVDADYADCAYADQALPISCGQTISQPYVVAYMTEQLDVRPQHRVLEVGTGSGYQAAVLAHLAREVITVERYRTLADAARRRLQRVGLTNVTVVLGDGLIGVPEHAPYDRIVVTAAAERIPDALVDELTERGVMVLPVGPHGDAQRIVRLTKTDKGVAREDLIWVRFVPLLPGQAREL